MFISMIEYGLYSFGLGVCGGLSLAGFIVYRKMGKKYATLRD